MLDIEDEYFLFVRRCAQFAHIHTIYTDLLSGHYIPSAGHTTVDQAKPDASLPAHMGPTVMSVLYAFFYSLVEDSEESVNAFRVWRLKFSEEEMAIDALEQQIAPMRGSLRLFRNRVAFHGSRSSAHESKGYGLVVTHSGPKLWEIMNIFQLLHMALLRKDLARLQGSEAAASAAQAVLATIPARCAALSVVRGTEVN